MSQARDLGDAANKANFLDNVTADIQPQLTPAGTIITFGGTTAPTGYLECNGQQVLQSDYPDLYAAIGLTWNTGPTGSYFELPDLRGAFLRGAGTHGISANNMANGSDFAGPSVGDFENDQFQGHKHDFTGSNGSSTGSTSSKPPFSNNTGTETLSSALGNPSSDGTNGTPRTGDETRPFNAGILYCIKT